MLESSIPKVLLTETVRPTKLALGIMVHYLSAGPGAAGINMSSTPGAGVPVVATVLAIKVTV